MAKRRRKGSSPRLIVQVTPEQYESAKRSHSGACLIADAIQRDYPHLSKVMVDMATIRVTDREAGERYTYLTSDVAQKTLLFFDQGWSNDGQYKPMRIQRAVKIDPITQNARKTEHKRRRRAELTEKRDSGQLTPREAGHLARIESTPERPNTRGPAEVVDNPPHSPAVVRGGEPIKQGKPHPNLLRGRNRHFGAKIADPGIAFREAVEKAVAADRAEREAGK